MFVFIRSADGRKNRVFFRLQNRIIAEADEIGCQRMFIRDLIGTNVCPFFIRKRMDEKADIRSARVKGA